MEVRAKQRVIGGIVVIALLGLTVPILTYQADSANNEAMQHQRVLISSTLNSPSNNSGAKTTALASSNAPQFTEFTQSPPEMNSDQETSAGASVAGAEKNTGAMVSTATASGDMTDQHLATTISSSAAVPEPTAADQGIGASLTPAPSAETMTRSAITTKTQNVAKQEKNPVNGGSNQADQFKVSMPRFSMPAKEKTTASAATEAPPVSVSSQKKAARANNPFYRPQGWVVQVGSFSQQHNAQQLANRLRAAGYDSYIRKLNSRQGRLINQVFIGPQAKRSVMNKMLPTLFQQFHVRGIVREYSI